MHEHRLGSRYLLTDRLGGGGMGEVFLVRVADGAGGPVGPGTDGRLAVKLLRPELADDPDVVNRFLREARLLRAVDHPNVVRVLDLVAEGNRLGIVMEYVPGGDLRRAVPLPCPAPIALDLLAQVADGLAAIHAAGITHRDLKPENVLLQPLPDGTVRARVTDFGVAYRDDELSTRHGGVIGTAGYLSPEGANGLRAGPAADVYALGVMLYELCTGRRPFVGESAAAVIRAHAESPVPRSAMMAPPLWDLVSDLLAKDPRARPDMATGARRMRALAGMPLPVAAPGPVPRPAVTAEDSTLPRAASHPGPAGVDAGFDPDAPTLLGGGATGPRAAADLPVAARTPGEAPPARRGRALAVAAGTVLLLVGGLGVALLRGGGRPSGQTPVGTAAASAAPAVRTEPPGSVAPSPSTTSPGTATASGTRPPSPTRTPTPSPSSGPSTPAFPTPSVPVLAVYQPNAASVENSDRVAPLVISGVEPGGGTVTSIMVLYAGGMQQVAPLNNVSGPYYATVTGLTNGTRYTFTARVCNSYGMCAVSPPVRFTPYTIPTLTALSATTSPARATVFWPALDLAGNPRSWTCRLTTDTFPHDPLAPNQLLLPLSAGSVSWTPLPLLTYTARETCTDGVQTVNGPVLVFRAR